MAKSLLSLGALRTGEVFFIPAGHVLQYDEPARIRESYPAYALQMCIDAMQKAAVEGKLGGG